VVLRTLALALAAATLAYASAAAAPVPSAAGLDSLRAAVAGAPRLRIRGTGVMDEFRKPRIEATGVMVMGPMGPQRGITRLSGPDEREPHLIAWQDIQRIERPDVPTTELVARVAAGITVAGLCGLMYAAIVGHDSLVRPSGYTVLAGILTVGVMDSTPSAERPEWVEVYPEPDR
jgi:hypothetical protein